MRYRPRTNRVRILITLLGAWIPIVCLGNLHGYPAEAFDLRRADEITMLAVVRHIGTRQSERVFESANENRSSSVFEDEFEVLDSYDPQTSKRIKALVPAQVHRNRISPRVGRTYLLLAARAIEGKLVFPLESTTYEMGMIRRTREARNPAVEQKTSNEVAGVALFGTESALLSRGSTRADTLALSLADCLRSKPLSEFRDAAQFLDYSRPPDFIRSHPLESFDETFLTRKLRSIADAFSGYRKARIYMTLTLWNVRGLEEVYLKALADAASDPSAFEDEIIPVKWHALSFMPKFDPPSYRLYRPDPNWVAEQVVNAKSPSARLFFLHNLNQPSTDMVKRIVAKLDSFNLEEQRVVLGSLARWNTELDRVPSIQMDRAEASKLIAYWKEKYKTK